MGKMIEIKQPEITRLRPEDYANEGDDLNAIALKFIEWIGRICHDSRDKIGDQTAEKFVKKLIKKGHTSVLEHFWVRLEVPCDSFIYTWLMERKAISYLFIENYPRAKEKGEESGFYIFVHTNLRALREIVRLSIGKYLHWPHELSPKDAEDIKRFICDLYITFPSFMEDFSDERWEPWLNEAYQHKRNPLVEIVQSDKASTIHCVTDRAVSHELVRHRTLSFTQQSQRYVDMMPTDGGNEIKPLPVIDPTVDFNWTEKQKEEWTIAMQQAAGRYLELRQNGCPAQEARTVLPNSTMTEIVVTGSFKNWHDFMRLRDHDKVYPPMRRIARKTKELGIF